MDIKKIKFGIIALLALVLIGCEKEDQDFTIPSKTESSSEYQMTDILVHEDYRSDVDSTKNLRSEMYIIKDVLRHLGSNTVDINEKTYSLNYADRRVVSLIHSYVTIHLFPKDEWILGNNITDTLEVRTEMNHP